MSLNLLLITTSVINLVLLYLWFQYDLSQSEADSFGRHPLQMYLSFHIFSLTAIISFDSFKNFDRSTVKSIHAGLHILAFVLGLVGLNDVQNSQTNHYQSMHSWLGLFFIVCQIITIIFSLVIFQTENSLKDTYVRQHRLLGIGIYGLSTAVILTGSMRKSLELGCQYVIQEGGDGSKTCWYVNIFTLINAGNLLMINIWQVNRTIEKEKISECGKLNNQNDILDNVNQKL